MYRYSPVNQRNRSLYLPVYLPARTWGHQATSHSPGYETTYDHHVKQQEHVLCHSFSNLGVILSRDFGHGATDREGN